MMEHSEFAVLALAIVAAIGVSISLLGDSSYSGQASYFSMKQSTGVCIRIDECDSGWRCCSGGTCVCADGSDADYYRSVIVARYASSCPAGASMPAGCLPRSSVNRYDEGNIPSESKEVGGATPGVFLA